MDSTVRTSFLIRRMHTLIGGLIEQELKKLSLTNGQYTVLSTIARRGGSSSAEIARRLKVKPQALNEFIPPFEQRGLITRRGHPDNRRILCIFLTDEGERLLKQCDQAVDRLEGEVFAELEDGELTAFRDLSGKLVRMASQFETPSERTESGSSQPISEVPRAARGFE